MRDLMRIARCFCLVLLALAVAHSAAAQAQPVDAFRLTSANTVKSNGATVMFELVRVELAGVVQSTWNLCSLMEERDRRVTK